LKKKIHFLFLEVDNLIDRYEFEFKEIHISSLNRANELFEIIGNNRSEQTFIYLNELLDIFNFMNEELHNFEISCR